MDEIQWRLYLAHAAKIFQKRKMVEITYRRHPFWIDYRIIPPLSKTARMVPIFTYPGSTSGWEMASELPYFLSLRGWKNIIMSPPGESNSSDAPEWFWKEESYRNEALLALKLLAKNRVREVILVGHSNGAVAAATMARMAKIFRIKVSALILLNPADVKKVRSLFWPIPFRWLGWLWHLGRFGLSGFLTQFLHRKEESPLKHLRKFVPPFKKPFQWPHFRKMLWEVRKSSFGHLPKILSCTDCPVIAIFSRNDFVFPSRPLFGKSRIEILQKAVGDRLKVVLMDRGLHNITLFSEAEDASFIISDQLSRL